MKAEWLQPSKEILQRVSQVLVESSLDHIWLRGSPAQFAIAFSQLGEN